MRLTADHDSLNYIGLVDTLSQLTKLKSERALQTLMSQLFWLTFQKHILRENERKSEVGIQLPSLSSRTALTR